MRSVEVIETEVPKEDEIKVEVNKPVSDEDLEALLNPETVEKEVKRKKLLNLLKHWMNLILMVMMISSQKNKIISIGIDVGSVNGAM